VGCHSNKDFYHEVHEDHEEARTKLLKDSSNILLTGAILPGSYGLSFMLFMSFMVKFSPALD
jgi:hypothetical protein